MKMQVLHLSVTQSHKRTFREQQNKVSRRTVTHRSTAPSSTGSVELALLRRCAWIILTMVAHTQLDPEHPDESRIIKCGSFGPGGACASIPRSRCGAATDSASSDRRRSLCSVWPERAAPEPKRRTMTAKVRKPQRLQGRRRVCEGPGHDMVFKDFIAVKTASWKRPRVHDATGVGLTSVRRVRCFFDGTPRYSQQGSRADRRAPFPAYRYTPSDQVVATERIDARQLLLLRQAHAWIRSESRQQLLCCVSSCARPAAPGLEQHFVCRAKHSSVGESKHDGGWSG